jgi:hypothetical protein
VMITLLPCYCAYVEYDPALLRRRYTVVPASYAASNRGAPPGPTTQVKAQSGGEDRDSVESKARKLQLLTSQRLTHSG